MFDARQVKAAGDAVGGWLIEIHNGEFHKAFSPVADTLEEAVAKAHALYDAAWAEVAHLFPGLSDPGAPAPAAEEPAA